MTKQSEPREVLVEGFKSQTKVARDAEYKRLRYRGDGHSYAEKWADDTQRFACDRLANTALEALTAANLSIIPTSELEAARAALDAYKSAIAETWNNGGISTGSYNLLRNRLDRAAFQPKEGHEHG